MFDSSVQYYFIGFDGKQYSFVIPEVAPQNGVFYVRTSKPFKGLGVKRCWPDCILHVFNQFNNRLGDIIQIKDYEQFRDAFAAARESPLGVKWMANVERDMPSLFEQNYFIRLKWNSDIDQFVLCNCGKRGLFCAMQFKRGPFAPDKWPVLAATYKEQQSIAKGQQVKKVYRKRQRVVKDEESDDDELEDDGPAEITTVKEQKVEHEISDDICCLCLSAKPNVQFNPCGHFATCEPCHTDLIRSNRANELKCPLCRVIVQETTKTVQFIQTVKMTKSVKLPQFGKSSRQKVMCCNQLIILGKVCNKCRKRTGWRV